MPQKEEILFGGSVPLPPKIAEFKKPVGRPSGVEIIEQAFLKLTASEEGKQLYGDPERGATLEQAWRAQGLLTGKRPVCLLATEKPSVATAAIERLVRMNAQQLLESLADLFGVADRVAIVVLYHDGYRGHAITLLGCDRGGSRFLYHDPWPGVSLLSKELNATGIDARRENQYWSITFPEFRRIVFAAFVDQNLWAEYMGEKYYLTLEELRQTDFWSFFNISETGRQPLEGEQTLVGLTPGGFQSEVNLSITVNRKNRLLEGQLNVKRSWLIGPPYGLNPFALDIIRSFIAVMIPPPDRNRMTELMQMLNRIHDPAYTEQWIDEGPEKSPWHRALFTYLGPSPSFERIFPFSVLNMTNLKQNDAAWLQIKVTTDAL